MEKLKPVFSEQRVQERIREMAGEISASYRGVKEPVIMVCVLKGAFVFFADLLRRLELEPEIDFVRLASYGDKSCSSGEISFSKDVEGSVQGRHVLIVEDIVDTGLTVSFLHKVFAERDPSSIRVCSLIHKLERRNPEADPDFTGFLVNSGFLVGCGLDYAQKYRRLPGIYEVEFLGEQGDQS